MKSIVVFSIIDFYMQSLKMTIVENMCLKYEIKQKPTIFMVGLLNYTTNLPPVRLNVEIARVRMYNKIVFSSTHKEIWP